MKAIISSDYCTADPVLVEMFSHNRDVLDIPGPDEAGFDPVRSLETWALFAYGSVLAEQLGTH